MVNFKPDENFGFTLNDLKSIPKEDLNNVIDEGIKFMSVYAPKTLDRIQLDLGFGSIAYATRNTDMTNWLRSFINLECEPTAFVCTNKSYVNISTLVLPKGFTIDMMLSEKKYHINILKFYKEMLFCSSEDAQISNGKIIMPDYVTALPIIYSKDLLKLFTPEETLAVTLHEIGHHVHRISGALNHLMRYPVLIASGVLSAELNNTYLGIKVCGISSFIFVFALVYFVMSTFLRHHEEFLADSFAAKLGYGKHLNSALSKSKLVSFDQIKDAIQNADGIVKKIFLMLLTILYAIYALRCALVSTHPNNTMRKIVSTFNSPWSSEPPKITPDALPANITMEYVDSIYNKCLSMMPSLDNMMSSVLHNPLDGIFNF